ncbi:hypothetical protein NHJ13051_000386 [Beauveria bassiana]
MLDAFTGGLASTEGDQWPTSAPEELVNDPWLNFERKPVWISPYRHVGEDATRQLSAQRDDGRQPPPAGFEYAEHRFLGDQMNLKYQHPKSATDQTPDGKVVDVVASDLPLLKLSKGSDVLELTYGEISALAGDFYGTLNPISDAKSDEDARTRFLAAYNTLADNPADQPHDGQVLIKHLQDEVDQVEALHKEKKDPSTWYKDGTGLAGMNAIDKLIQGRHFPIYSELLKINWDHFGDNARAAYRAGHSAALQLATTGEKTVDRLVKAYSINAFADHFLQDLFSAGHLRTPRRLLHGGLKNVVDVCANKMHDEDCALGLSVSAPKGNPWQAYGDKRLLDKCNEENLLKCQAAIVESWREIYDAWDTRHAPEPAAYKAFDIVPTKASALSEHQTLAPLFKLGPSGEYKDLQRRLELKDRKVWKFKTNWWPVTTVAETYTSGLWKYPITM